MRRHLADGGCFSYAVYAHDEKHRRFSFREEGTLRAHAARKDPGKRFARLCARFKFLLRNRIFQRFKQRSGSRHTHVGNDHCLLQFVIKVRIDALVPGEQACEQPAARFGKPLLQFFKKALLLFHALPLSKPFLPKINVLYALSLNRADTIFEIPFSSIATP